MTQIKKHFDFSNIEKDSKYIEGVVYKANSRDSDNQFMNEVEIQKMAKRFMRLYGNGKAQIDLAHNNIAGSGFIIKSDFNFNGDWIIGVQIEDEETWQAVKKGELNGFSIAGSSQINGEDELINVQIDKISIVPSPANQETFSVVKSEKSILEKLSDYLTSLKKRKNNQ